jgi:hypothetical protein
MFQTKVIEKIKTYILYSIIFSQKSCCSRDNVEKYGTARQDTDANVMCNMHFAYWITKTTHAHTHTHTESEYVIIAIPQQQWL